ncbi:MAG: putative Ig domain-containing protein, partial [Thermoplasmata archaeon]|nr:putative Ig domain-containing protein [Thermoplasmata archaeon]
NNTNGAGGGDYDVHYRCNLTGSNWEDIQVISEPVVGSGFNSQDSVDPLITVNYSQIYVAWEDANNTYGAGWDTDIFVRCNLTGNNWEAVQVVSEPLLSGDMSTGSSYDHGFAAADGKIYVVWEETWNYNGAGWDEDIFYRCNLTGYSWEPIQVISEPVFGQNFDQGSEDDPKLAAENGVVYVTWGNSNNTNWKGTDYDIVYRVSFTGLDWEPIEVVSEPEAGQNFNQGSEYYADIAVDNGKAAVAWPDGNYTFGSGFDDDIHLRVTNLAPKLWAGDVTPASGNTSTWFNFTVTVSDLENEAPKYVKVRVNGTSHKMLELDPGDTNYKDGKDYYIELNHLQVKVHKTKFVTFDGFTKSTLEINRPIVNNIPPKIITTDLKTATEDVYYERDYDYEDIDLNYAGQQGTWSVQSSASWLTIDPVTGVLSGTPTLDGQYTVNVTIDDGVDIDWSEFKLTVQFVNDPPIIGPEELPIAIEDELYKVTFEISDEESPVGDLTCTITTDANWLIVNNGQHKLNGTPTNDDVGEFWVRVRVSDGALATTRNYTLTVVNVNDAPVIITEDVVNATVDEYYAVDYEAIDVDPTNDTLKWSLKTNAGTWLQIDKSTGWLHGTPLEHNVGEFWVDVIVTDGMEFDNNYFMLAIEPLYIPNENPLILTEDVLTATAGELYYVQYEAIDDRTPSKDLNWSGQADIKANASWLSFDTDYGTLSGIPGEDDVGVWNVYVAVNDDEGGLDFHNFVINVTTPPTPPPPPPSNNTNPELSDGKMEPSGGTENTEFTFSVHYTDDDGDAPSSIIIVVDGEEQEMTLKSGDPADGDYEYKTTLPKGYHSFYFVANDGEDDAVPTDDTPTSGIDAVVTPEVEDYEKEKEAGFADWIIWAALVIVIIIILAILFFLMTRRKSSAGYSSPPPPPPPPPPAAAEEESEEWEDEEE